MKTLILTAAIALAGLTATADAGWCWKGRCHYPVYPVVKMEPTGEYVWVYVRRGICGRRSYWQQTPVMKPVDNDPEPTPAAPTSAAPTAAPE